MLEVGHRYAVAVFLAGSCLHTSVNAACSALPGWVFSDIARTIAAGFDSSAKLKHCPIPRMFVCQGSNATCTAQRFDNAPVPNTCDWDVLMHHLSDSANEQARTLVEHFECPDDLKLICENEVEDSAKGFACFAEFSRESMQNIAEAERWLALAAVVAFFSIGFFFVCVNGMLDGQVVNPKARYPEECDTRNRQVLLDAHDLRANRWLRLGGTTGPLVN